MRFRVFSWFSASLMAAALPAAFASDLRPSGECLPADTAVMLRMPQPAAFLEALRSRTKFGSVALADRRLEGLWGVMLDTLRAAGDEPPDDLEEQLAKYELQPDDLKAAFRGDMGTGVVYRKRGDGLPPLVMALAWLEPGEETARRLVTAMQRRVEERNTAGEADAPKRVDLEMAGHEVLWMVEPIMTVDTAGLDVDIDDDDDIDAEEFKKKLDARLDAIRERVRNAKFIQVGQTHAFLARLGGRLLAGHTLPDQAAAAARQNEGDRDFDIESGTEEAKGVFERFLAEHAGDARALLAEALDAPGMAAALPAGIPLADLVVDPRVFITASADDEMKKRIASIGADDLGPLAWRQSLDAGTYRSGMFVTLPGPRQGLMRILDQACDPADVPSFAIREAIDFTQISLDLGAAYETVKEFAVGQGGPETANMFTAVEMQAQGWLGVELPKLLASAGSRHWIVTYPSQVAEALAEARKARGQAGGVQARQVADRIAIVWQIEDEAPFIKILQRLAGMSGGELQEEQGFRGVRIPDGAAIYVGQQHLVVAIGNDSLEKTLAAIRNPPSGEASLRESNVPRRAAELLPLDPARMFGISDSSRSGGTLGVLRDMAEALVPEDVEASARDMLAGLQKLLPTETEMEGMFGVGVTTMRADDAGVSLQTAWEMPAP